MLTHALSPTGGVPARLLAINGELRTIYQAAFTPTLEAAIRSGQRFETPDGAEPPSPTYAADAAGCRSVNRHLAGVIQRHFPGAELIDDIEEPAVVDSLWHHPATGATFAIGWDHARQFGDPFGLTVREVGQ